MLLKQGIFSLRRDPATLKPGVLASFAIPKMRIRASSAIPKEGRHTGLATLKPGPRMGLATQGLDLRAGHTVPGPGLPPERSKNERA